MSCEACAIAAKNAWSGMYATNCRQCTARMASHAPDDRRNDLVKNDPELLRLARAEWKRRQEAKA